MSVPKLKSQHNTPKTPPSQEDQQDVLSPTTANVASLVQRLSDSALPKTSSDILNLQRLVGNRASTDLLGLQRRSETPVAPRIQRQLDRKPASYVFVGDLDVPKGKQSALNKPLTDFLNYASQMEFPITYDWLVSWTKSQLEGLDYNFKRSTLSTLQDRLLKAAGQLTDESVSGERGHMFGRHVLIDSEFQEKRLREEGRQRATRIDEGETGAVMAHIRALKRVLPNMLREHFKDVAEIVHVSITDQLRDSYTLFQSANGNQNKKRVILDIIADHTSSAVNAGEVTVSEILEDYLIDFVWSVRVNGGRVTLNCGPEVEILQDFQKIESTLEDGDYTETRVQGHTHMYWGSNAPSIDITQNMGAKALRSSLSEIDFGKLGVTHY